MEYGFFKRRNSGNSSRNDAERRERGGSGERNNNRYRNRGEYRERNGNDQPREGEESVFSKRVRAGKRRTYFFDVRKTRGNDYFITITESTRSEDGYGYRRHKIFLYKEDFNRFVASLNEVVQHVKTNLLPDFDYEEFDRRQAEWEAQQNNASFDEEFADSTEDFYEEDFIEEDFDEEDSDEQAPLQKKSSSKNVPPEHDISW